ncbi:MAG: negative regulator of the PHO system [Chaenotheca gracillima]|nr:MAG: negative regulator of the PHO system [Chaenotheca gracillima]
MTHRNDRHHLLRDTNRLRPLQNLPTTTDMSLTGDDEASAEADEPPDDRRLTMLSRKESNQFTSGKGFTKSMLPPSGRRESLLTRALVTASSSDDSDEHDVATTSTANPKRGQSAASTASTTSAASTVDLTSDGFSSPARTSSPSPPFHPTSHPIPFGKSGKIVTEPVIADKDHIAPFVLHPPEAPKPQKSDVEATLGRKRCITFACGRKAEQSKPVPDATGTTEKSEEKPVEQPKRRCALRFACPSKLNENATPKPERPRRGRSPSPAPTSPKQASSELKAPPRVHRNSESTIEASSPRSVVRPAAPVRRLSAKGKTQAEVDLNRSEATRFHEFASSMDEEDEWMNESPVHRHRLTVDDTLKKENAIRKIGEEAEEEALEEDEEATRLEEEAEAEADENNDDDTEGNDDDVSSDGGNETDDEEGFAQSDDESDAGSDYMFWTPGRTATDNASNQPEHIRPLAHRTASDSSIESMMPQPDKPVGPPSTPMKKLKKESRRRIPRPTSPELPDSTDFVCGTLDEDRPLEAAYVSCLEERRRTKHSLIPQDIDPSFPTSEPDDDDDEAARDSDDQVWIHGKPDDHVEGARPRAGSATSRRRSPARTSPPPPSNRLQSPPPPRRNANRSPPPPVHATGRSPRRMHSPPPARRLRSPPLPRLTSPSSSPRQATALDFNKISQRPNLFHTKSLPRTPNPFRRDFTFAQGNANVTGKDTHHRGAVDIYKGLEKKRQRRKEKTWYKHCQQRAAREKERKPRPGKGVERMRELGLEMAGKVGAKPTAEVAPEAQYVLSI